ncbi:hypothetical protein [Rhizobium wenxiniae]|uniref:hypothetical protein n=1 Tax=Rhizobium wenxiniae TaxID=1737357 RepID=UPI003C2A890A
MYKEEIITDKARALANIPRGFLFYRDQEGVPHKAENVDINAYWGIADFFTCSHPSPRTIAPVTVKILVGANAYACIEKSGSKTDILLSPGKSAPASLREYAADQRGRAERLQKMAELAEMAAVVLERAAK